MKYKMLHTCLRVMDLDKSLKFYSEAMGLNESRRKDFPKHEFTLVFLQDEDKQYEIELTYNYNPEKPYEIGNGFSHLAFGVDDLEMSRENHMKMGYEVTKLMGLPGTVPSYYFVTDPDNYQIEINRQPSFIKS